MTTNTQPPSTDDVIEELLRLRDEDRTETAAKEAQRAAEHTYMLRRIEALESSWPFRMRRIFARG